ncbi:dephospho-CoA kinase [Spirilliplanes yamanashiensis]|uniref:Dephospho-CoA kinase n=1 Tax=Spirilliplanes yamanashiensis TaxID=42233 RepID=A0A8J4DJ13_9ACTN|nr:dephospho-CoA kinase [Spirilliplanes yamanashiensis]MDP9817048.1 dephospho-CoA kinase [Spirilliplanes yamanashiensis]GIJ03296.1 dephospho-CoA kinase [Spirilliplanes yamanashiensis]
MLLVGLTGGIGAGKSVVATRLAELGAVLIDADRLAREVVAPGTEGLARVAAAFGPQVLAADGSLDRPALGARVFGDEAGRRTLEGIVHPLVRARTHELAAAAPADAVVVNDVPLLVEVGLAPTFQLVVVVEADEPTRLDRLVRDRGMTPDAARARIAAQASDAQRAAAADVLLRNDGTLGALLAAVDRLYRDRLVPYEAGVRSGIVSASDGAAVIADPDPAWPAQAARLLGRVGHALRDVPGVDLAHIGSTAVPGLPAKDVIDLQVGVPSLAVADDVAAALGAAGLPRRPGEWADIPRGSVGTGEDRWPKRLHGSADPDRAVNLHVRVTGSPGWRLALLVRDHLRADGAVRDAYGALKRRIAAGAADIDAYADTKEPWFDTEAAAAEQWAARTGWRPSAAACASAG